MVDPEFVEDYVLFSLVNLPFGESTDIPYGPENANAHRTRSNLESIEVSSWLIGGCSEGAQLETEGHTMAWYLGRNFVSFRSYKQDQWVLVVLARKNGNNMKQLVGIGLQQTYQPFADHCL